eukprot:6011831-Alexandrium_andersonii.AAC.1
MSHEDASRMAWSRSIFLTGGAAGRKGSLGNKPRAQELQGNGWGPVGHCFYHAVEPLHHLHV